MPPNSKDNPPTNYNEDNHAIDKIIHDQCEHDEKILKNSLSTRFTQQPIVWSNVISTGLFHIIAIGGFFATILHVKFLTIVWAILVFAISGLGMTAGSHRLWAHRSYKAKLPLKIILLWAYTTIGMNTLYDWVRDHRVHHKYSETDADPYNSKRGFFFAHVGWLLQKKHPEVVAKKSIVDMSDIENDPLLAFHTKYFLYFKLPLCFVLPTIPPILFWYESWLYAIIWMSFIRTTFSWNVAFSVNSFAHIWGKRPYDKRIRPAQNTAVSIFSLGEGWHNYHHVFPWDYRASEFGKNQFNFSTTVIDFFQKIGWAYDVKTPSTELIRNTIKKYGEERDDFEIPLECNT